MNLMYVMRQRYKKVCIFALTFNDKYKMNTAAGITIEHTATGRPAFARIDLRKHADMIPILKNKGAEVEKRINWSATMKKSFAQAKNGEWEIGDINNFWGE